MHDGKENMAARRSTRAKLRRLRWCDVCGDNLARINMIYYLYAPGLVEYSSLDKMAKYDWNTFRNYVAFLAGGTRRPHHDSELTSCYHEAFLTQSSRMDFMLRLPNCTDRHQMLIILTNSKSDIWILRLTKQTCWRDFGKTVDMRSQSYRTSCYFTTILL